MPLYIFIYFEIFLLFSLAFFIIKTKQSAEEGQFIPPINIPLFIVITGIIFRITLFPSAPTTSPDVYRYIWEGKITAHGINPYLVPPNAPQLNQYHSFVWDKVGFKNMTSIYPPFAQLTFLMGYYLSGESVWGLKLIYLICEIITLIFLLKLLKLKGKNPAYVILYAWLPIPVMEYFINMHIDVTGIAFFIIFLYYMEKGKFNISAVFYSLSFLVKLYPLFIFPLLLRKIGIKKLIPFSIIFLIITFISYAPFLTNDLSIKNTLAIYLTRWEFNGAVFNLFKAVLNQETARILCGIFLITAIIAISFRYKNFINGTFGILLSFVIFATTLYPWYLGWIASINPLINFFSVFSLLFTSNFSNFTPLGRVWREYWWVLLIEYVPFFILLLKDLQSGLGKKTNPSSF
jgi:alpha-1,6-mannosyltransferase